MKRKVTRLLALMVALLLLAGTALAMPSPTAEEDAGRTATIYMPSITGEDAKRDNEMILEHIESLIGFDLNFVWTLKDNYKEKMNVVFVSGEKFDAVTYDGLDRTWNQMAEDGLIIPLNDLLEEYGQNLLKYLGDGFAFSTNADGETYAIPIYVSNSRGSTPTIRYDWALAAGLDGLPTTVAEYEQFMQYVLDNDVNGNGDPGDEVPLMPLGQNSLIGFFAGIFMGADGIGARYLSEDGKVMPRATHPLYMDFLDTLRDWYAKGYIYKEFFVIKEPQINDMVTADRIGSLAIWYSRFVRPFESVYEADPSKIYMLMPTLASPSEGVTAAWNIGSAYANAVYIPKVAENADLIIKYLDWQLADPNNQATARYGIKGVHWDWEDEENLVVRILEQGGSDAYNNGYIIAHLNPLGQFLTTTAESYIDVTYARLLEEMYTDDKHYEDIFDRHVPYYTIGTDLEFLPPDADTMLTESELKYIIGEIDRATMEKTIADYMAGSGEIEVEVRTQQYNEFMGLN